MSETPRVETLNCPKCGGQVTLYTPDQTERVACAHCNSLLDLTGDNAVYVETFLDQNKKKPAIPLGSSGEIRGEKVIAIGFLVRKIVVEHETYRWSEYLLYKPGDGSFRWLTTYNGHWTYVRPLTDLPTKFGFGGLRHRDQTYKHFQASAPVVDYVLGEFYWKVKFGERVDLNDYVSPPFLLSEEKSDKEVSWSLGLYIQPDEVQRAFRLTVPLIAPTGVFANQPNPATGSAAKVRSLAVLFGIAACLIYGGISAIARNEKVYDMSFNYSSSDAEKSRVTNTFVLQGHTSNLRITNSANVNNQWVFLRMALINSDTGDAVDFGREISYYNGNDSEGAWSEGRMTESTFVPSVPSGTYYLRLEPEISAPFLTYGVEIVRDVPRFSYLMIALVLLLVPWLFIEFWRHSFEVQRWAESDHPLVEEADDDE